MKTIKKLVAITFIFIMMFSSTVSAATLYVGKSDVNVRSSASTSSKSLGKAKKGAECTVIEDSGEWTKVTVEVDGKLVTGYIRNDMFSDVAVSKSNGLTKSKTESKTEAAVQTVGTQYVYNKNKTNGSNKFHYASCGSVDQMKEKNKEFITGTRDDVLAKHPNAVPCKKCNP